MNIIDIVNQLPRNRTQDSAHPIGSISKLIIHHDAQWRPDAYDDLTRYRQQANFHIGRGEDGLQYHYKISNLGDVYQCRNLTDTLWHCGNYPVNRASIAICLDGNMEEQQPTQQQLVALQALLDHLCTEHPEFPADNDDVFGHREVGDSACPGTYLIGHVIDYRNDGQIDAVAVKPNPPVVQDPPAKPEYWRVYDYNGAQVGAYSSQENAQKKLDTIEAGTIKNPQGVVVVTKEKKPPVTEPPFVGDPNPPVTPEPPKTEEPPANDGKTPPEAPETPTNDEKKGGDNVGSEKYSLSWSDFVKAAKGSLYTFIGVVGTLLVPFAESVKNGKPELVILGLGVASAFVSALANLCIRFFTDTTK